MIEVFGERLESIRDIINNSNNKYKDAIAIQEKKNKKRIRKNRRGEVRFRWEI